MNGVKTVVVCNHGRPQHGGVWWRGIPPCDDCETEDWQRVRRPTIIGLAVLIGLIMFIPTCMMLAGVFW